MADLCTAMVATGLCFCRATYLHARARPAALPGRGWGGLLHAELETTRLAGEWGCRFATGSASQHMAQLGAEIGETIVTADLAALVSHHCKPPPATSTSLCKSLAPLGWSQSV